MHDADARLERPSKELKAFRKVTLQPHEAQDVILTLDMCALAYYDDTRAAWVAEAGDFDLLVGTSSADLPPHGACAPHTRVDARHDRFAQTGLKPP